MEKVGISKNILIETGIFIKIFLCIFIKNVCDNMIWIVTVYKYRKKSLIWEDQTPEYGTVKI